MAWLKSVVHGKEDVRGKLGKVTATLDRLLAMLEENLAARPPGELTPAERKRLARLNAVKQQDLAVEAARKGTVESAATLARLASAEASADDERRQKALGVLQEEVKGVASAQQDTADVFSGTLARNSKEDEEALA